MSIKRCNKCKQEKPLEEFHRDRRSRDGRMGCCKACNNERARVWQKANPELEAERLRSWRKANRERVAEMKRAYYAANAEHIKERVRAYRAANPERHAETNRAWRKANPEKHAEYAARSRARHPGRFAARTAVNHAIRDGKMRPARDLPCSVCGESAQQYHHWSYAPEHWLDVIPVCIPCHTELDRTEGATYRQR